jgi:uncharacterized membrane protein
VAVRERASAITGRLIGVGGEAERVVVRKAVTIRRPREEVEARWRERPPVGSAVDVTFAAAPGDRGTEVLVELVYTPPAGSVGDAVAKLRRRDLATRVAEDLRRFKQVLETGEVVRA